MNVLGHCTLGAVVGEVMVHYILGAALGEFFGALYVRSLCR